jgi:hypothetical protein
MFIRSLILGLTAGLLSGAACMVFAKVYADTMYVDFSPLVGPMNYFGACIFGCVLASIGFWAAVKVMPKYGEGVFNLLFAMATFASILGPIAHIWPLDADQDLITYFPMYAMTLHFFPAVVWFALKPWFMKAK